MVSNETAVAEKLLQAEAVILRPEQPFTWASGWKSPIYCDNRRVLGLPYIREFVKSELCNVIFSEFVEAELLAGVATAGIAWGAMAADQLKMPFIYVRPQPKAHGLGNQIEGYYQPGQKVLVVEDLVSTGKSSLQVVTALQQAGLEVCGMVSIFTYGFPVAQRAFEAAGVRHRSLTHYSALIALALQKGLIAADQQATLEAWRNAPESWGI
jgi:orotate phosphoribosyltransferase